MNAKILLTTFTALTLLTTACSGEDLQGRFGSDIAWGMTLSSTSPSGSHTVSATDTVLAFTVEFEKDNTIASGAVFRVDLQTDEGLAAEGVGAPVTMQLEGASVGSGKFTLVDPAYLSEGFARIKTTTPLTFEGGVPQTFTITTDTTKILDEEAGIDDMLVATVEHNGHKITGSRLSY